MHSACYSLHATDSHSVPTEYSRFNNTLVQSPEKAGCNHQVLMYAVLGLQDIFQIWAQLKLFLRTKQNKKKTMKNNKSFTDSEAGLNDPKGFRKGTPEFFHEIQGLDLKQWMN